MESLVWHNTQISKQPNNLRHLMVLHAKDFNLSSTAPCHTNFTQPNHRNRRRPRWECLKNKYDTCLETQTGSKDARNMVNLFDPTLPIERALTPPGCWYTHPDFLQLELERVFYRGWQVVGFVEQVRNTGDFFTGKLGAVQFLICRDVSGDLRGFHNVCRHHASLVAFDSGNTSCFVCPYHGWTYGLDGILQKATRSGGIQDFKANDYGLLPISVTAWGPFVLMSLENKMVSMKATEDIENSWLGNSSGILSMAVRNQSLKHVARREYTVNCNWKVFCDNYLDGGYHVPYAHRGLAGSLNLKSYSTQLYEKVSIQTCESINDGKKKTERLGGKAIYAFVYPNFMINRYGPWMDTNLVLPLGTSKCLIIFDYFLESSQQDDNVFIEESLIESDKVQMEDKFLCESVQEGLTSPGYKFGRYAPEVEMALYHFHQLLHKEMLQF